MASQVYFLRPVGMEGPVKIGHSVAAQRRLETYQQWSPLLLEIVALTPGDLELERRFHALFRPQLLRHEWFDASPRLTRTIKQVAAGAFDFDSLPEGVNVHRDKVEDAVPFGRWVGAIRRLGNMQARGENVPAEIAELAATQYDLGAEARAVARQAIVDFVDAHYADTSTKRVAA